MPRSQPPIADFDSASAMLRATARYLRGKDFPRLGMAPSLEPLALGVAGAINRLPRRVREQVYTVSGVLEAATGEQLGKVRAGDLAQWAVRQYPQRAYPAVAIGSSNGAAVHLWSALGIPWLPPPLELRGLDAFLAEYATQYAMRWIEESRGALAGAGARGAG